MLKKISVATVLTFAVMTKASANGLLIGILALGGGVAWLAGVPHIGTGVEANNHVTQGQPFAINDWCVKFEPNNLEGCKATKKAQLQKFAEDWNSDTPEAKELQAQPATQPAK